MQTVFDVYRGFNATKLLALRTPRAKGERGRRDAGRGSILSSREDTFRQGRNSSFVLLLSDFFFPSPSLFSPPFSLVVPAYIFVVGARRGKRAASTDFPPSPGVLRVKTRYRIGCAFATSFPAIFHSCWRSRKADSGKKRRKQRKKEGECCRHASEFSSRVRHREFARDARFFGSAKWIRLGVHRVGYWNAIHQLTFRFALRSFEFLPPLSLSFS